MKLNVQDRYESEIKSRLLDLSGPRPYYMAPSLQPPAPAPHILLTFIAFPQT